jgi:hypothetical protein
MALSLLLIVFPLYAEGYRWLNPLAVPAAPLLQRATITTVATSPGGSTATTAPSATTGTTPTVGTPPAATETPTVGTPPAATETPTVGTPPAATETPTVGTPPAATETPTVGTPLPATETPTTGPSPTPTATLTPLPNEPPLRLNKAASVSSVQTNQKFNYTLTVFSNSGNASTVDVRDTINPSLEVLGADPTNGSCSVAGNVVTCQVSVQNNQPVTINISVQVRSSATAGQRIANQALAQDDRSFTAASDDVVVDVSGGGSSPATSTRTPGGPNETDTPVPTSPPSTVIPTTPNPTATPRPNDNGNGDDDDDDDNTTQPAATSEIILPPIPQEGFVPLPPTPRSGGRPAAQPVVTRLPTVIVTVIPSATAVPTPDAGVFFSMGSDWGSAFTNQEINYDILFQNTRESGVINNLSIISALPDNLQFVSASAGYGPDLSTLTSIDPKVLGSEISLTLNELNRGQWLKISIKTKVKDLVATGARIVSQAEATFDGLALPVRTKPVYVLIVGSELGPSVPLSQAAAPSATPPPSATPLPSTTPSVVPTAVPSATSTPLAVSSQSQPQNTAGGAVVAAAPLPATSQGIPISGVLLLGLTLLLRTVRIHRAQSRI